MDGNTIPTRTYCPWPGKPASPPAKAKDNSTRMAAAKVDPAWFAQKKLEHEKAMANRPSGNWTINVGGNIGPGVNLGGGVATGTGGTYYYDSIGIGKAGVSASATFSFFATRRGCQITLSYFNLRGVGFTFSSDFSWAIGIGTPGVSIDRSCI